MGVTVMTGPYQCVVFDMDGTLTLARLDFDAIRAELGLPAGADILAELAALPPPRRLAAEQVLLAHELEAARAAELAPGAFEAVARVRRAGLATVLLTRNTRAAMDIVLDRFALRFDLAWAREDGPIKPSPDSILAACRALGVQPDRTVCVGDWIFDLHAAHAAGCTFVLLARGRTLEFAGQADHVIQSLAELPEILGI